MKAGSVKHFTQSYQQQFDRFPQVVLEVVSDLDMEKAIQLIATIQTSRAPEEALSQLRQFDKAWFLSQLDRIGRVQLQPGLCISAR
jgi:hypothetical protein